MKKIISCLLILLLVLASFSGCGKKEDQNQSDHTNTVPQVTEPEVTPPSAAEVEAQLRLDAYPESSQLMRIVGQAVSFSDISVTEETVRFTITAPHFGAELIAWYDSIDYLEEGALNAEVARLLESESVQTQFTLSYTRQGSSLLLRYTEDYLNAAGCGIREYYNHVYTALLEEMGVAP